MMNINEDWITGNRYLSLEEWVEIRIQGHYEFTAIMARYRKIQCEYNGIWSFHSSICSSGYASKSRRKRIFSKDLRNVFYE